MKICSKCKQQKDLSDFFARKGASDGKMSHCKDCSAEKQRRYVEANREKINAYSRESYRRSAKRAERLATSDARKAERKRISEERKRKFRAEYERRESVRSYRKAYKSRPDRKEAARQSRATDKAKSTRARYVRERRKADPKFMLNSRMSCMMYAKLKGGKEGRAWKSLVDYTIEELRSHIERQFLKGMSWDNASEWHIDHIVPVASFDFTSTEDPAFRRCWALTNLRPLWRSDNIRKGAKVETIL